ncbi:protein FAR-RED IMPAIRED RESPONSE 1-like [Pistacia vera]|uniref:protein FAR-RED IMPAIRED RESPONSE 1-like n=1 Tax=Pistacia vera TaxID=55513 RepID=UPI00126335C4|nr:protein FAR-RED IMPAIRED RESPONSE 1-like [Pistacia vera]
MESGERNVVLEAIFYNNEDDNSMIYDVNEDGVTHAWNLSSRHIKSMHKYKGFAIVKKSACKGRNGDRKYQTISCDKGRKTYYENSSKRINCIARLSMVLRSNGKWQVTKVQTNHNHDLDPSICRLMARHKNLNLEVRRNLEANDIAGIRPCKSIRLLEIQFGGLENLICLSKDCHNFIEKNRKLRLGEGDVESIHQLFLRMQQKDRDFFHLIDVDSDSRFPKLLTRSSLILLASTQHT